MSETVNMHFVPQTYLEKFAREVKKTANKSVFLVNSLNTQTMKIKEIDVGDVCFEKHLYRLDGDTPEERQFIENMYGVIFESGYSDIYRKLSDDHVVHITPEERSNIIGFVISLFYRNTVWNRIGDKFSHEILDRAFDHKERTGIDVFEVDGQEISIANMTREEAKKKDRISTRQIAAITAPSRIFRLASLREKTDIISVQRLPDGFEFVTSDHPVIMTDKQRRQLIPMDPTNSVYLPIDKKHLLCLSYCEDFTDININRVGRMPPATELARACTMLNNNSQSYQTERWIFGSDSELKKYSTR